MKDNQPQSTPEKQEPTTYFMVYPLLKIWLGELVDLRKTMWGLRIWIKPFVGWDIRTPLFVFRRGL